MLNSDKNKFFYDFIRDFFRTWAYMYQHLKTSFFALFLLGFLSGAFAQMPKGFSLESSVHYGKILKHTPKLTFPVDNYSWGFELNARFQTYGRKPWHSLKRYPLFGVSAMYFRLGDKDLLGSAFAIVPNLALIDIKRKHFDWRFQFGAGLGYLTQRFDLAKNPSYNAVGSKLNSAITFRLGGNYKVNSQWAIGADFTFTHFSNGGSQLPNFGVNVPAASIGLKYTPNPLTPSDYTRPDSIPRVKKRFGVSMHFDLAFRETIVPGGPRYPTYIGSLAATYMINAGNRFHLGIDYEFNKAVYVFGLHTFDFNTEEEARIGASRLMVFIGDEFHYGNWSTFLQLGYYLGDFSFLKLFPIYNKLSIRYYLPPVGRPKTRFFAGVYLKSHLINAEYISFGFGAIL